MPRKIEQKQWKCESYHEMGSRNPKVDRLGEKTWHDSKERNELAHIH